MKKGLSWMFVLSLLLGVTACGKKGAKLDMWRKGRTNMWKRSGWMPLLLVLILSLTACGKTAEAELEPDRYGGVRYIPVFRGLDIDMNEIQGGCVVGDYVYLTGCVITNEDYQDREIRLLRIPLEGGEIELLPIGVSSSGDRNVIYSTEGISVAAGEENTLWLLERIGRWDYNFPEDFDPYDMSAGVRGEYYIGSESQYALRQLDGEGNELSRQEWSRQELEERLGMDYIDTAYISVGGDVTFWSRSGKEALVTMDQTGKVLGRVAQEGRDQSWQGVVRLGDGRLAVWGSYREGGSYQTVLSAVSARGDAWEESWTLPEWSTVYGGDDTTLFYYNVGGDLLAWQEPGEPGEDGEEENLPLLSWVNTGLSAGGDRAVSQFLPDGRLVIVQGGGAWNPDEPVELAVLTPTDDPPEKTVLTLGTAQLLTSMEDAVRSFNRTNPDYRIEVREYVDFSAGESWQDGLNRLATEVGAGKVPDILDMSGMSLYGWAASGILEDLWPWIDLDRDIDREDLMLRVLEAESIDGRLYELSDGFSFSTVMGARSAVGDRMAWTLEDMWEALENMPEGCLPAPQSRDQMMLDMIQMFWDRFVDWEKGTCSFDSKEFREILTFCSKFPEESVGYSERDVMLRDRELMLMSQYLGSFWDIQKLGGNLRGEMVFVGLPNPWGEVGSGFVLDGGLAMTSAGRHKEGVWAFLRTMLLPQRPSSSSLFVHRFPLNREAFEEMAWEDRNGKGPGRTRYGYSDSSGKFHAYRKTTQAEYDQIMALYEAVDSVYRWDDSLGQIIMEIAGACFAGDKTIDETAALIQNRAALYISEQS